MTRFCLLCYLKLPIFEPGLFLQNLTNFGLLSVFGDAGRSLENGEVVPHSYLSRGPYTASTSESNRPEFAKLESGYDGTTDQFERIFNPDCGSLPPVSLPNPPHPQPLRENPKGFACCSIPPEHHPDGV